MNRAAVGVALYCALAAAWIYGIANTSLGESDAGTLLLVALAAVHVGAGYVIGQWWALVLPLLPIALAVPAGLPPTDVGEPLPIWFAFVLFALPEATLVALGVAVAKRRRAS
jgi:hypothetical protein